MSDLANFEHIVQCDVGSGNMTGGRPASAFPPKES
jgi:hypothetical protein